MRGRQVVLVLFALVLAASGLNVVLALTRPDPSEADSTARPHLVGQGTYAAAELEGPGGPALDAAVATLPLALSYDYRHIKGSVSKATRGMTKSFATRFEATFARTALPLARDKNVVTDAVVRAAGLVRVEGEDRALCLVYVDQRLVSSAMTKKGAGPTVLKKSRVLVTLFSRDGEWLVDGIRRP